MCLNCKISPDGHFAGRSHDDLLRNYNAYGYANDIAFCPLIEAAIISALANHRITHQSWNEKQGILTRQLMGLLFPELREAGCWEFYVFVENEVDEQASMLVQDCRSRRWIIFEPQYGFEHWTDDGLAAAQSNFFEEAAKCAELIRETTTNIYTGPHTKTEESPAPTIVPSPNQDDSNSNSNNNHNNNHNNAVPSAGNDRQTPRCTIYLPDEFHDWLRGATLSREKLLRFRALGQLVCSKAEMELAWSGNKVEENLIDGIE